VQVHSVLIIRSVIFNILFYLNLVALMIAALPTLAAFLLVIGAAVASAQAPQPPAPLPAPLPLFPPDNWWNVDVTAAPVDVNSTNFINVINPAVHLHPDFGGSDGSPNGIYGMVYAVVPGTQALEPVTFVEFGSESDSGAPGRPPA
jgi:hypothetical protein